MMNKRLFATLLITVMIMAFFQFTGSATAQAQDSDSVALEKLLNQTGYTYVKKSDTVWFLNATGKFLPKYSVIVTIYNGVIVTGVVVAEKNDMQLTPDAMFKLLRANSTYDSVKIGLDKQEDLFVRIDLHNRGTDLQELKDTIKQVVLTGNAVYDIIEPYLIKR